MVHQCGLEGTLKLPKEKEENLNRRIGTGLFTLGIVPDRVHLLRRSVRAEWQADAVDTVGAAFLGLTVGCARCHDHKFDPISQRDYYRMTALFAGSVEREIPLGSLFDVQTATRNFPLLAQAEAMKRMARGGGRGRRRGAQAAQTEEHDGMARTLRHQRRRRRAGSAARRAAAATRRSVSARARTSVYANVLAHEEVVPDTHILIAATSRRRVRRSSPGICPR